MFHRIVSLLLFLAAGLYGQDSAIYSTNTIPNPTKAGTGYVTSLGGYLSGDEISRINALVTDLEAKSTVEIAVVVVPALEQDIFTTAQELFDLWQIGKKGQDNGLLILTSIHARQFRTHTGYGMEALLPDAVIQDLQSRYVIPRFKEGRYGAGIVDYLEGLAEVLRSQEALRHAESEAERSAIKARFLEYAPVVLPFGLVGLLVLGFGLYCLIKELRTVRSGARKRYDSYSNILKLEQKGLLNGFVLSLFLLPFGSVFLGAALAIWGIMGSWMTLLGCALFPLALVTVSILNLVRARSIRKEHIRRWRTDPRKCPECGAAMNKLDEAEDDQHLKAFQIAEERIDAKDYDVWVCSACANKTIETYQGRKFALYTSCPSCHGLTGKQEGREVVTPPTYGASGKDRLVFSCLACQQGFDKLVTVPRLQRSSSSGFSSSGGGGSSFGGGSSGGGGSTSSW